MEPQTEQSQILAQAFCTEHRRYFTLLSRGETPLYTPFHLKIHQRFPNAVIQGQNLRHKIAFEQGKLVYYRNGVASIEYNDEINDWVLPKKTDTPRKLPELTELVYLEPTEFIWIYQNCQSGLRLKCDKKWQQWSEVKSEQILASNLQTMKRDCEEFEVEVENLTNSVG